MMDPDTFDISMLERDADLVAIVVPRDGLFGLLRRTVRLPGAWMALAIGPGRDCTVVAPGGEVVAGDVVEVMFVRAGPQRLTFEARGVGSADEYLCDVSVSLSVEVSEEAADLTAFRSALMGSTRGATRASLQDYLKDDVRRGVASAAAERSAAALVDGLDVDAVAAAVREACGAACFSAGVRLVGELSATFASPELAKTRARAERTAGERDRMALQQQLRQAGQAARRAHLEHVEQMLVRLRQMAEGTPEVSVAELIRQFGQDERGQLYRGLQRCSAAVQRCGTIVVAAGDELVWLDPDALDRPAHRRRIEAPGGAVRSVRLIASASGEPLLAVGTGAAIALVDAEQGQVQTTLSWPGADGTDVRGGINSMCRVGGAILATHSELGLCTWPVDPPHDGQVLLADLTGSARTVRLVQADAADRVWLSVDDAVLCLAGGDLSSAEPTRYVGAGGRITALAVTEHDVYAGTEQGRVVHWSLDEPDAPESVYGGGVGACQSINVATVMGIRRLGLADGSDAVKELVLGDTVMDRYVAAGDRLRQAWWSDDRIVAVDELRVHLHVWTVGSPDAPTGTADIGRLCSNRAQDVCVLPT